MKRNRKRMVVAGLAGLVALGGAGVYAAGITVAARDFGAGSDTVSVCDSTMTVVPTIEFSNSLGRYNTTGVKVTGIDAGCDNAAYTLSVSAKTTGGARSQTHAFTGTSLVDDVYSFTLSAAPGFTDLDPSTVTGWAVYIYEDNTAL